MPQAVAGAIAAFTAFSAAHPVLGFIAKVALNVGLSTLASKLLGSTPDPQNVLQPISVTTRDTLAWRTMTYGTAISSGPIRYENLSAVGNSNSDLWVVIPVAQGRSSDLVSVWLDGDEIPKADIAWTAGVGASDGSGSGEVSTAKFVGQNSEKAVRIYYYLGYTDQPVCGPLNTAFADVDTNFRLRGVSYVVVRLRYNANTEEIWTTLGKPQNIRVVMQGQPVYDPRKDSTNGGSGTHRYTDEDTWEFSDTPPLCVAHYLMQEMNVAPATDIDWTSVADAADDCEVLVAVPVSSTEKRFTCNGALSHGARHKENLDALLSSMDGRLSWFSGVYKMRASVWEASSVTLTESDMAGGANGEGTLVARGSAPRRDRFNTLKPVFVDPDQNYESIDAPQVSSATYITRDNGRTITLDLILPCTNSNTMAQRIAKRLLEQGNSQEHVQYPVNSIGAKVAIGDVIDLTIGELSYSAKTFRCIDWSRTADDNYDLLLREDVSGNYTDPAEGDYFAMTGDTVTAPSEVVPPPTMFSATGVPLGIKLSWKNPAVGEFDFIDVYESAEGSALWSTATKIASVRTDTLTISHAASETYGYWLRARRNEADLSTRVPDSDTTTVTATSLATTTPVQLAGANLSDVLFTANDAEAAYRIASTGEEQSYEGDGGTFADIADWLLSGAATDYDCRLTKISGDNPTSGSALATWHDCSTTRTWTWTDTTADGTGLSFTGTIEIRDTATLDILASANVTVEVEKKPDEVSLSGTTSVPNFAFDFELDPATAQAWWTFNTDGTVDKHDSDTTTQFAAATQWIIPNNPSATYYIRATNNSGSNPTSGPALSTWHALTSVRTWTWSRSTNGNTTGSLKIEIATDAAGTDIVATGYYGGNVTREAGT